MTSNPTEASAHTQRSCFIVSPISDAGSPVRLRSDHVRKYIVGEALEPFDFTVRRADTMNGSGIITEQIVTELLNADLVVADLTDHNPNVFYELALRHAVKKPFIHMIKDGEKIPFDVATLRTVFYDTTNPDSMHEAKMSVRAAAKEIIDAGDDYKVISPVTISIDLDKLRSSGDPNQIALADIQQSVASMENVVERLVLRERRRQAPPQDATIANLADLFARQTSEGRFTSADMDTLLEMASRDEALRPMYKRLRNFLAHSQEASRLRDDERPARDGEDGAVRATHRGPQASFSGNVDVPTRRPNHVASQDDY
ncbi:hypothetical protein [Mycolicibacterium helvum]|uniref:Uncharacterized protein n=1 Tax=Mycolicibacterium helvum TaxID=1534349 RepID=A0A7I7THC9_9MYCO|nr:hypothetical protein [Mycolicibacterium helvum]BBY67566.1 hypothetical protein MHEL_58090 [Mycolicibacterium helvum]